MKRTAFLLVSVAAVLLLTLSLTAISMNGSEEDPIPLSGNFDNYIPVGTVEDLEMVGSGINSGGHIWGLDAEYYLTNDITFELGSGNFVPIGSAAAPFKGIFDGNGYTISGMTVSVTGADKVYAGLFGYAENADMSHLTVADGSVAATATGNEFHTLYVGGIVGYAAGTTTVSECLNACAVSVNQTNTSISYAGGVVGGATDSARIEGCTNEGTVKGTGTSAISGHTPYIDAGGVIGQADSKGTIIIERCINTGDVSVTSTAESGAGGIVGDLRSSESVVIMESCINSGAVSATVAGNYQSAIAGGLCGSVSGSNSTVVAAWSSNEGTVTASSTGQTDSYAYAGGLFSLGYVWSAEMIVESCTNEGTVTASTESDGARTIASGIFAYADVSESLDMADCRNTGDITASTQSQSSFAFASGVIGYITGPLSLEDCSNAGAIRASSSYYVYMGGIAGRAQASATSSPISFTRCSNIGEISTTASAVIYAGGTAGYVYAQNSPITFDGCYNTGDINAASTAATANAYAGGVSGYAAASTSNSVVVSGCYNTGNIDSRNQAGSAIAGGLTSFFNLAQGTAKVEKSYNEGDVRADSSNGSAYSGGAVGYVQMTAAGTKAIIENSYNIGDVTGKGATIGCAGGIVGIVYARSSAMEITNCYSVGKDDAQSGSSALSGGIASGLSLGSGAELSTMAITNCYFLEGNRWINGTQQPNERITASGSPLIDGGASRVEQNSGAYDSSSMRPAVGDAAAGSSIYYINDTTAYSAIVPGWDFANIWTIIPSVNGGYPVHLMGERILTGTVTDGEDPLEGVMIEYDGTYILTDIDGKYSITTDYRATVTITDVFKDGYTLVGPIPQPFEMTENRIHNFIMSAVSSEHAVSGIVSNNGNPLEGVSIGYAIIGESSGAVSTDQYGGYTIPNIRDGSVIRFDGVAKAGYSLNGSLPSFIVDSDKTQDFTMTAAGGIQPEMYSLSGMVTHMGNPHEGVTIAYTAAGLDRQIYTGADGKYTISGIQHGTTVEISGVTKAGYSVNEDMPDPFRMTGHVSGVDFTMDSAETFVIAGTVTDIDGEPLNGVSISYDETHAITGSDGRYSIIAVAGSTVIITDVRKAGYEVNETMPVVLFMDEGKVQDFTMTEVEGSAANGGILASLAMGMLLIIAAGAIGYFVILRRREYEVVKITSSLKISGADKARRKKVYSFSVEGGPSGTVTYRVGDNGAPKTIVPGADGTYRIPKEDVIDKLTLEYRSSV